jgi:hypothetical protein
MRQPARASLPTALASGNLRVPLLLMTILAFWLSSHPWRGIWHDGALYAVQALRRLYPANFQHDLYFLHGSQDAFTLFSPLYASAIAALGLHNATLALLVAGYAIWLSAAVYLLSAVLRGFHFWLGLAMLIAWPADYGPTPAVFRLAESFLTPRLLAEGLGIFALGCFLRARWTWGAVLSCLAVALHPLIGSGPLLAGALLRAWGNWRALALLLGSGAVLLAAGVAAAIPPFDRLLTSMDAEWLAVVARRAPMVTWTAWQAHEWVSRTALAFSLVGTAAALAPVALSRLFRCVAVLGALGLLASWLGTGLTANLLLIQVQPWRLLWLTHLCAWLALAWLLAAYWQHSRLVRMLLLVLCLAALARDTIGGAVALAAGAALYHYARRPPLPWPAWGNRTAYAVLAALAMTWLLQVSWATRQAAPAIRDQTWPWLATLWGIHALELGGGALMGTVLLLLVWRWGGHTRKGLQLCAFSLAFGSLCVAISFAAFPSRRQFDLSTVGEQAVRAAFLPLIPPQALVYWQNNVQVSWYLLHRANYASNTQITGLAFNRGTAIEGVRRMERLRGLGSEDAIIRRNKLEASLHAQALPAPDKAGLLYACSDPILDFVVLTVPLAGAYVAQARDVEYGKTYYLYECARLRAGGSDLKFYHSN